jgi:hypothetical protein
LSRVSLLTRGRVSFLSSARHFHYLQIDELLLTFIQTVYALYRQYMHYTDSICTIQTVYALYRQYTRKQYTDSICNIQTVYALYRQSLSVRIFIRDFIATKVWKSKLCKNVQFSYFCMISVCCMHNFLTKSYRYGIMKNIRQLRVYRHFGKTKNYLNYI